MDLEELFINDPGIAYHIVSKLPFKYNVGRYKWSFPGFFKKLMYIKTIGLPNPDESLFKYPLPDSLEKRRSVRSFQSREIPLEILSTLLYYSAGVKNFEWGYPIRMFPSAGGLNSPEIYLVIDNIEKLEKGLYHYDPYEHKLGLLKEGSISKDLYNASLRQECILEAPMTIVLVGEYSRTSSKYGVRGYRYFLLDIGHLGMNIYLVATSLGLGTVCVGAFEDEPIEKLIGVDKHEIIVTMYPIGYPSR